MEGTTVGGDITQYILNARELLTADNYNEIDALVFAELSYMKYESRYLEDCFAKDTSVKVNEFANEIFADNKGNGDIEAFLRALTQSERYRDCIISNMAAENTDSQWAALTVEIGDASETSIIAMRGTNGTTLGWTEDFQLAYAQEGTKAQQLSAEYLKNCSGENIYLTGHSKGGNDIMSGYIMNEEAVRQRVVRLDNFDGPGMNKEFCELYSEGYLELCDKLNNYYPKDSILGLLLIDDPGSVTFIASETEGHNETPILGEHDLFSFQIDISGEGSFQAAEQSLISKFGNAAIDGAMSELSNEEREHAMQALIKLGVPALIAQDSEGNPFADSKNVIDILRIALEQWDSCTSEEQEAAKNMIIAIFSSGKEYAKEQLIEKFEEIKEGIKQRIQNAYNKLVEGLQDTARDIYDGICHVSRSFVDKVDSFYEGFQLFVSNIFSVSWRKKDGNRQEIKLSGEFSIDICAVQGIRSELENTIKRLRQYCETVTGIRSEMNRWTQFGSIVSLRTWENALGELILSCDRYGDALLNIADTYVRTENSIICSGLE